MTLREEQIKNISKLIESADYVQNRHLLNVEQIVMLCNTEIEKRIDETFNTFIETCPNLRQSHDEHRYCINNERSDLHYLREKIKEILK